MPTNFPTALDTLVNPSSTDKTNSVTVPHASQHANINDAVEALQAKVGIDGSTDITSLDYKINHSTGGGISFNRQEFSGQSVGTTQFMLSLTPLSLLAVFYNGATLLSSGYSVLGKVVTLSFPTASVDDNVIVLYTA